jgi:RHS repeat-associated protein
MHQFGYDSGTNGKGRLTSVTDPIATTTWSYTAQGRVASRSQVVSGVTQLVSYGYNSAGQLAAITTPSEQLIGYTYLNHRIVGITVNGTSLISAVVTTPFGPVGAWQWGNGLATFRDYDSDGRLMDWEFRNGVSILRSNLSWDNASRITAIADPANAAIKGTYQYDALDRITQAQKGNPVTSTQQFGYDALGNRLNVNVDGNQADLSYGAANNHLTTLAGALSLDPLHGELSRTYIYNLANRLTQVSNSSGQLATYQLNALGQRVAKSASGTTTRFVYDEQGHLLGEYQADGKLIQETVWLDDLPVATLRPHPGSNSTPVAIDIYYVHADHLGTPRAVTRPSDNAFVWRWDNVDPFGANAANENPSGAGAFNYALRFPGQYYDAETGTNYNYHRDYDPTIGRYLQSDPIGLEGGLNSYGYATQNPLSQYDEDGLLPIPLPIIPIEPIGKFQRPPKVPGQYACNARCPTNPTGVSCPQDGCPVVYGYGVGASLGDAVRAAKSDANDKIPAGCQGKHCTYKCTGPKGDPFYPSPG